MREYLNADGHANTVRLLQDVFKGPICVIEGDSDRKVYIRLFDRQQVRHVCAGPFVKAVVQRLNATATAGVFGIMDADFCRLDGNCSSTDNLFLTDYHDLEVELLFSGAFSKALDELGSEEKLKQATGDKGVDALREVLLGAAAPLGALRWLNKLNSYRLDFEKIDFSKFIDATSLVGDTTRMCNLVCQRSEQYNLIQSTPTEVAIVLDGNPDQKQLCCGHDMVEVMGLTLRKCWGSKNASDVSEERLSQSLRLAYSKEDFTATLLYQALRNWQQAHPDYRLFVEE
ncbi:MAG: DUF4435 domain-containing protein [Phycisphaerales bacterium]|nr:DUF4435 domain-containing protein [Phycisphaerales bacterium]